MLKKTVVFLCLLVPAVPVMAGNVTFLKNSAIAKMSAQDFEFLRAAARNALDYTADGQPRRWTNSDTGASGVVTPLSTTEDGGSLCRELEIFNDAQGFTGRSVFTFCRQPDGTWRVPAPAGKGAAPAK